MTMRALSDKAAIGLSLLCTIHCLFSPLAATLLPAMILIPLEDEIFHQLMVLVVVPVSAFALLMGCKKHGRYQVLLTGCTGLLLLGAVAIFGHDLVGEMLEKMLTVVASIIIALGHVWNYHLCQHQHCDCHLHDRN